MERDAMNGITLKENAMVDFDDKIFEN